MYKILRILSDAFGIEPHYTDASVKSVTLTLKPHGESLNQKASASRGTGWN